MKSSEHSRRDIFKLSLGMEHKEFNTGLPLWIHEIDEDMFQEFVDICQEKLSEEQIADLLESDDLGEAMGLLVSFLNENGEDGTDYLLTQGYFNEVND